ncbi:hypothetical protein MMC07_001128 [Pseudocyphellaria aurata]|nr:hypothetical protein [Pseudocyphellaria aurata]
MSASQETVSNINGKARGSTEGGKYGLPPKFQLDLPKLQSLPPEQRDLYLFTFTVDLEKYVTDLGYDEICSEQTAITQELFQIISLSTPVPTGAIRKSLGRCFAYILAKGDRKTLYESINRLVTTIDSRKSDKELQNKHAAVHCLGNIYKAAGDSAISLCSLSCSSLLRLSKPAQDHAGLRAGVLRALANIVEGVRGTIDEGIAREIWKYARTAASGDKAALVQASACKCLEQLVRSTEFFDTTGHFEGLKTTVWKTCESSIPGARHAAASCLAAILVKSYTDHAPEKPSFKVKKVKRPSRIQPAAVEEGEEGGSRSGSPSAKRNTSKIEFTLQDLLKQLSVHYVRSSTGNKARAAITHCYVKILRSFNPKMVESAYMQVAEHLFTDILSNPFISHDRHRLLLTRKYIQKILTDCLGSEILGETGRLNAAKMLINDILKNYPQVIKERSEPSKHTLIGALDALASLIKSLGAAFAAMGDNCCDTLIQVLQHPSYSVQIHVSHCLRVFVQACPQQLLPCASICMNSVSRELGMLASGRHSSRRCVGFANGLAAVLSVSPLQPLYSSLEISSRVLSIATSLLKSSSKAELRVSETQVQVAWIFIGGLMSLGPNFVKIHISQLLLLWRNALPRPLTVENSAQRQSSEISYLAHVRECALGSILSFLQFNNKLITTDVSKRIAILLQNTLEFLESLSIKKNSDDVSQRNNSSLQLQDLILMVRRRVLQCYTRLISFSPLASGEILTQSNLVTLAVSLFADPENHISGSLGSSIANSAGNFENIWDIVDNSGFGVSGLIRGPIIKSLPGENDMSCRPRSLAGAGEFSDIDEALLCPILGAREHDSVHIEAQDQGFAGELPDPPATEVVNSAISLFATALPLQSPKVQEGVLEQLATCLSSNSLHRNPGRKAAVTTNIAVALLGVLKVTVRDTVAEPGELRHPAVEKYLQEILHGLIMNQDRYIRNVAYAALGRLCNSSGNTFTTNEINILIDTIVSNRDPNARAGCAMALGSIHSHVGGMAAGYHLKKIHSILMSLCSDPHPAVHSCAIEALSQVADSAGLTYAGYVSSTLGLLAQLWTCDTHNEESATVTTSNHEFESPTPVVIARCVDSLVNVLGPDLQDMSKIRELILTLIRQFEIDDLPLVQAEGLRAMEHIYLYDSKHIEFASYVRQLQDDLDSPHGLIRGIAVDGLYNLMRRDAQHVIDVAREGLEDQIWILLNENPEQEGIHNIVQAWLGQTSLSETGQWITRCQHVLTKTTAKQEERLPDTIVKVATTDLQDEEVAGFASSNGKDQSSAAATDISQELLRWQVRAFALKSMSDMIAIIGKDMELDGDSAAGHALQQRIADVVRMAFLASTSSVVDFCIGGLRLIDQVLMIFGTMPDPDFSEALLLEQYQAQISSALAPAFGAESSPELACAAVDVCATFIATGLVTDVDRMGRILKLLVSSLDSFTTHDHDDHDTAVGDLRGLSFNARTMIRMAVLSAWAELQVASREQPYLVTVMEPYITKLTPLWLSSLQEFARLRFEPDISNSVGPARTDESLDTTYAALNRQTLLKFYQDSWLKLVDAIASLIDQDSNFVFDALDGKTNEVQANSSGSREANINYRDEPVAFFFVLFGISIEALVTKSNNDSSNSEPQTLEILSALKKILRPSVSGNAIFQDVVFSETIELFDRLALTEGLDVQLIIVDIVRNLCLTHPSAKEDDEEGDHLNDDIEQLFELTRIIVLVLASILPNLAEHTSSLRPQLPDEAVSLVQVSLEALVDASDIFPSIIKTDLHASIFHIFATILGTGTCQAVVIPQALPILRRFLQTLTPTFPTSSVPSSTITSQLLGFHHRLLSILAIAQRRESDSALPCAKNTLLALTILLTTSSRSFPPSHTLLTTALDAILECLQDIGLAKVASGCLRSLLLTSPKSPTEEAISRYLFPRLLRFLLAFTEPDPENARSLISNALVAFALSLPSASVSTPSSSSDSSSSSSSDSSSSSSTSEEEISRKAPPNARMFAVLSVLVPALLARAAEEGKPLFKETAQQILQLASADQLAFRGVVARMDQEKRAFMEGIIRQGGPSGGAGRRDGERDGAAEPTIALKLSFGGT